MNTAAISGSNKAPTLEDQIAELDAKRLAIVAARQKRADSEYQTTQLAAAQQALADEEALDAAEREHGARRIGTIETAMGKVILKRPHMNTFRKFQDKGNTDSNTLEFLVRPCLVHPTMADFERYCAEEPATLIRAANAVSALAGVRAEELAGKS